MHTAGCAEAIAASNIARNNAFADLACKPVLERSDPIDAYIDGHSILD